VDAIGRANLDAEGILDAVVSDSIGHDESISENGMSIVARSMVSVGSRRQMIGDSGHRRM
jgi:hypothetical protein